MFTRQHFEAIADILNANGADEGLVLDFAQFLAGQNPNFDRRRFLEASFAAKIIEAEATPGRLARLLDSTIHPSIVG